MPSPHSLYTEHQEAIDRAIAVVVRRQRLAAADAEEFASEARLHLLKDDCAALRAFQGRSSLSTYLAIVLLRLVQDWRNRRWGRWRSSAEARRQGALAVQLEALVWRDRYTFDEACEVLRTRRGGDVSRADLEAVWARLPHREPRRFESPDVLEGIASADGAPDSALWRHASQATAHAALRALDRARARLSSEDRLILRLRFTEGLRVSEIARRLQLDAKPLYRRIERLLDDLAGTLRAEGIEREATLQALDLSREPDATAESGESGSLSEREARSPAADWRRP